MRTATEPPMRPMRRRVRPRGTVPFSMARHRIVSRTILGLPARPPLRPLGFTGRVSRDGRFSHTPRSDRKERTETTRHHLKVPLSSLLIAIQILYE